MFLFPITISTPSMFTVSGLTCARQPHTTIIASLFFLIACLISFKDLLSAVFVTEHVLIIYIHWDAK